MTSLYMYEIANISKLTKEISIFLDHLHQIWFARTYTGQDLSRFKIYVIMTTLSGKWSNDQKLKGVSMFPMKPFQWNNAIFILDYVICFDITWHQGLFIFGNSFEFDEKLTREVLESFIREAHLVYTWDHVNLYNQSIYRNYMMKIIGSTRVIL